MPEIAECYTIAKKLPTNEKILKVEISSKFNKYLKMKGNVKFLKGFNIDRIIGQGKSIWIYLSKNKDKYVLVSQLGMTGSWFLNQQGRPEKNDHLIFYTNKNKIRYSDPRMFGSFRLYNLKKINENQIKKDNKWGMDVYQATKDEIQEELKNLKKSSKPIKSLLLQQNILWGIGNYLASEVLNYAQIDPYKAGIDLKDKEIISLAKAIKTVVNKSIEKEGYSFAGGYIHPDGKFGSFQDSVSCYNCLGKICKQCKRGKIIKNFIEKRSVYYCNNCQKK